jgi:hypothetical protein
MAEMSNEFFLGDVRDTQGLVAVRQCKANHGAVRSSSHAVMATVRRTFSRALSGICRLKDGLTRNLRMHRTSMNVGLRLKVYSGCIPCKLASQDYVTHSGSSQRSSQL